VVKEFLSRHGVVVEGYQPQRLEALLWPEGPAEDG